MWSRTSKDEIEFESINSSKVHLMTQVVFAHGNFLIDDGESSIDRLKPYLSHHEILEADYGFLSITGSILFNNNVAGVIKGMAPRNSVGIGHSNGCYLLIKACQLGAKFKVLILINPSLPPLLEIPESLSKVIVLYNRFDYGVWTAKLFSRSWGDMGRVGYLGDDPRVSSYETHEMFKVSGHSSIFRDKPAELAEFIEYHIGSDNYCQSCGRLDN